MNPRSITVRLVVWYAGVSLLACAGFALYTYFALDHFLRQEQSDRLQRRAREIGTILSQHMGREGDAFTIDLVRTSYAPENNDRFIRIRRPDGSVFYLSGQPADRSFDPGSVPASTSGGNAPLTFGNLLIVRETASVAGEPYTIDCGASRIPDSQVLHRFGLMLAVVVPIFLILLVAGGAILIRRALRPVTRIIDGASAITSSNLGKRLPVEHTSDELEHLSQVLNQMIARLEDALQHSQRFSADASHELRTPLTIMRIELESLSQSPQLPAVIREKILSILEETERMGQMVEGLLAVSRLDTGEAVINITRFDLSRLVASTAEQIALLAEEKEISIEVIAADPLEISGDRIRLQQVIVNLLGNAIKYAPRSGHIALETRASGLKPILTVTDDGPGIPPDALPHVFDRFFRADTVRTHGVNGAGLGLSIVRSICQAHSGTVAAENIQPTGCRISVTLPLAQGASQAGI